MELTDLSGEDMRDLSGLVGETALLETVCGQVTGSVTAAGAEGITVACDRPLSGGEAAEEVSVSVFTPQALYKIVGPVDVEGVQATTSASSKVERVQRRRWPRRRMDLAVVVCAVSDGRRVEGVPGRTVDVGLGGLCVETLRPVEGGDDPMVIVSLPDGTSLVAATTTVAAEDLGDGWRYRLAFRGLDGHDSSRLADIVS